MNNIQKKQIAARVFGKVQGVFFRASTQQQAVALGITGFVKNEKDGTVYLEAVGEPVALESLVEWLHKGPKHASVDKVEVYPLNSVLSFETFEQIR